MPKKMPVMSLRRHRTLFRKYWEVPSRDTERLIHNSLYSAYSPPTVPSELSKYNSIAAASILAKVYHDQHIEEMCDKYPILDEYYDLYKNMGYGTKKHLHGIDQYGVTQFHRKSYKSSFNKKEINI